MRKTLFCLLALLTTPAVAQTPVVAGSNIGLADYPSATCVRPRLPEKPADKPPQATDKAAVTAYNADVKDYNGHVEGYNAAMTLFNSCMKTYVDNGNNDMQRIKQKLDQAIAAANAH